MTKRGILLLAALGIGLSAVGAYLLLFGPGTSGADAANPKMVALGRTVYAEHCAECHGKNLEGEPDWRTPKADGTLPAPPHDDSGHTWHHGDGATTTTSSPGAPYPATDITYRYARADTTVRPRVDVTYTARFRVNGGEWRDIDETVTIAGTEGSLRIAEAHATLSGDYG